MRLLLCALFPIVMLFLNEIETAEVGTFNLSPYSEGNQKRIATLGTSKLAPNTRAKNLLYQLQSSAGKKAFDLNQPPDRSPNPKTGVQTGLPGNSKKEPKKRKAQEEFRKPKPLPINYVDPSKGTRNANSPLNQFAHNIEHYNELLTTRRDRQRFLYGNHVRTNLRSKNYYGQVDNLSADSNVMDSSKGSGSLNKELSLFPQKGTNPPEEPYHKVYPTSSRPRKQQTNQ